jgi:hypothetical protein
MWSATGILGLKTTWMLGILLLVLWLDLLQEEGPQENQNVGGLLGLAFQEVHALFSGYTALFLMRCDGE